MQCALAAGWSGTPDDVWLYNAAGMDYQEAGDHERALNWLSEGLQLAMEASDPEDMVEQLTNLSADSLNGLGLPLDELQSDASQFLAWKRGRADENPLERAERERPEYPNVVVAVACFLEDESVQRRGASPFEGRPSRRRRIRVTAGAE